MLNLPIQSLEYSDIRQGFIDFLKSNPTYKDWNFEASGISTQVNILAYHAHMLGYFVKMLLDESFVDSAHTKAAMFSHAKKTGYVPKGMRAARAEIELKVSMDLGQVPLSDLVLVPKESSFTSANNLQDTRNFHILDDVVAKDRTSQANIVTFTTGKLTVYEGHRKDWRFRVDTSVMNQKFVIKDDTIDIDTLRVYVKSNASSDKHIPFQRAQYSSDIDKDSQVYYISTDENGHYQIFFGANVFGVQPENGNEIHVTYISTNGITGNGAKVFNFNPTPPNPTNDFEVGNFKNFEVITHSNSSGGMESETVENMRFTIPHHYRRQNRLVNVSDYKSILLEEFRNIDSINVWGGEKSYRRDYGKVYCSIKPKNSLYLTGVAKKAIKDEILEKYGVVASDIVFIDPEYIDVETTITVTPNKTNNNIGLPEIERNVIQRINEYSKIHLNQFSKFLSDIDMLNFSKDSYIQSLYSSKILKKNSKVNYGYTGINIIIFANEIRKGTLKSSVFQYGNKECVFKDDDGEIYIYSDDKKLIQEPQGNVDYKTGRIDFKFPEYARIKGFDENSGFLTFSVDSVNPDIKTELNNIVRITKVRVEFND